MILVKLIKIFSGNKHLNIFLLNFARNFSLLIVATVKDIKKKMNKEINPDQE